MADDAQQRYAAILGVTVAALRSPWGAQVRFIRDCDDDGSAYLLCVAVGTPTIDADGNEQPPDVYGYLAYADGRQDGPKPVLDERRRTLLEDIGISV
ncbi:MAG: hypothetical protein ABW167_00945 [Baekduia sp.]